MSPRDDLHQELIAALELSPCPFCGGKPEMLNLGNDDDFYIHCVDCEVQQIANYKPHVAARRWNARALNSKDET